MLLQWYNEIMKTSKSYYSNRGERGPPALNIFFACLPCTAYLPTLICWHGDKVTHGLSPDTSETSRNCGCPASALTGVDVIAPPGFFSAVPVKFLIVLRPVLSVSVLVPVSTTDVSTVFTSGIISSVVSICSDIR